jgi:excisionase family DNA binding protein
MTAQQVRPEHLLTSAEVAALVFVDPKTVSRWAAAGKIPFQRTPGGHRRFRRADVHVLMPEGSGHDQRPEADAMAQQAVASALEAEAAFDLSVERETAASQELHTGTALRPAELPLHGGS